MVFTGYEATGTMIAGQFSEMHEIKYPMKICDPEREASINPSIHDEMRSNITKFSIESIAFISYSGYYL